MTRYFGDPGLPLEVGTDGRGFPLHFSVNGHQEKVLAIANRWRVDQEWWRKRPIHRSYFKVLTGGGVLCEIYEDGADGKWYLERQYD